MEPDSGWRLTKPRKVHRWEQWPSMKADGVGFCSCDEPSAKGTMTHRGWLAHARAARKRGEKVEGLK